MPVSIVANGSNWEITCDSPVLGIRVPMGQFDDDLAPVQGILLPSPSPSGTWTATGPNDLESRGWFDIPPAAPDPIVSAQTVILVNHSGEVSVRVEYVFNRPEFVFGEIVIPADPAAFHWTTIRVLDGQPSILFEEWGDVDVGYRFNCWVGLQPDRARYRGYSATTAETGVEADGVTIYRDPTQRAPQDATATLTTTRHAFYGNGATATARPAIPRWEPTGFSDTGYYWMLYNLVAGSTANLVGAYFGKPSRILGATTCGTGIYNDNGNSIAGIQVNMHRVSADLLSVWEENRYAWGLYISTKANLLDPTVIQPIQLQCNKHSGLADRVASYKIDGWTNPVGGFGKLLMGETSIASLKALVRSDFSQYDRIRAIALGLAQPTIESIIDHWWLDTPASLTPVITVITDAQAQMEDILVNDMGAQHFPYHHSQAGQLMYRPFFFIDQALASEHITPAQISEVKKAASFFANVLWDNDWTPLQKDANGVLQAGVGFGLANQINQVDSYRDSYALYLGDDPAWSARAADVITRAYAVFLNIVNEFGASNASSEYWNANLIPTLNLLLQGREMLGVDPLATDTRIAKLGQFFIDLLTPVEPRFGLRKYPAFSDGYTRSIQLPGVLATTLRPYNPTMAAKLHKVWVDMGQLHDGFFGSTLLVIDETATSAAYTLESRVYPGYLYVTRGLDTIYEAALWVVDGEHYSDHRSFSDQGAMTYYAFGAPISLSWGNLYSPVHVQGGLWRTTVQPSSHIAQFWDTSDDLPFSAGNHFWPTSTPRGEFNDGSQTWRRIAKFVPVEGQQILAVRDFVSGGNQYVATINLMAQGVVTPPTGGTFTPPSYPDTPLNFSRAAGTYKWTFTGQWGVHWHLWVVAENAFEERWDQWSHTSSPTVEANQFFAVTGTSFQETMYIVHFRTTGQFKWAITPYLTGESWNGTVVGNTDGLKITGPLGQEVNTNLLTYEMVIPPLLLTLGEVRTRFAGRA